MLDSSTVRTLYRGGRGYIDFMHCHIVVAVAGRYGYTAIHVAADNGDAEMLDLLLSARSTKATTVALTAPASDGQSPLSLATADGHSAAA